MTPLSVTKCPYCDRHIDLTEDDAVLIDGTWWHFDCWDEDAPYYDPGDDDED